MEFNLPTYITEKLYEALIPIDGVAYNPNLEEKLRIDFREDATNEQRELALGIADDALTNRETLEAAYQEDQATKITPEKVQPLVDLLVSKGILTEEEIINL